MENINKQKKYRMFTIRVPEELVEDVERLAKEREWTRNKAITFLLSVGQKITAAKGIQS